MAKVIITLHDQPNNIAVDIDMRHAKSSLGGGLAFSPAVVMGQAMCKLAEIEATLSKLPACRKAPPSLTLH